MPTPDELTAFAGSALVGRFRADHAHAHDLLAIQSMYGADLKTHEVATTPRLYRKPALLPDAMG